MEGLQAPWSFELRMGAVSFAGCCVVLFSASATVVYIVCLNAYRAASTQAMQVKVERLQEHRQRDPAEAAKTAARAEQASDQEKEGRRVLQDSGRRFYKGHIEDSATFREEADNLMHNELRCGRTALSYSLQAPYSCLRSLNRRMQLMNLRQSGVWLLPVMLAAQLLAVGLCALGLPTSDTTAAWILCTPIGVVTVMMIRLGSKLYLDKEFVNIDYFEEHRKIKEVSSENFLKLASIIYVFFANAGLATSFLPKAEEAREELTQYEELRNVISRIFGMAGFVNIQVDLISDGVCISLVFAASVSMVLIWVALYQPLIHLVMQKAGDEMGDEWTWSGRVEQVCVRMHLYEEVGRSKYSRNAFLLLSDTLFLPVVTNLLKVLSCTYDTEASHLRDAPGVTCWTIPHTAMAVIASVCLFAYVPTVVFGASFMLADSDGILASEKMDLIFESRYLVLQTLMKVLLSVTSVFVGPLSAPWSLSMQFVINLSMTVATIVMKPCSVLWVNYLSGGAFSCTTLACVMAFYDVATSVQWWPLLIFLLGFMVVVAMLLRTVVTLRRMGGCPTFVRSRAMGAFHGDTMEFDDVSRLRGTVHRLRQITFWTAGDHKLKGVQSFFEVDGVVIAGAPHQVPGQADANWGQEHFLLEPGEEILEARGYWHDLNKSFKLLLRTNREKEFRFDFDEDTDEEIHEFKQEPDMVVVALHGGLGGDLHNLGFISVARPPAPKRRGGSSKAAITEDDAEDRATDAVTLDLSEGLATGKANTEEQEFGDGAESRPDALTIGIGSESGSQEHTGSRKAKKKQGSGSVATPGTPTKKRTKKQGSKRLGQEGVTTQEQGRADIAPRAQR